MPVTIRQFWSIERTCWGSLKAVVCSKNAKVDAKMPRHVTTAIELSNTDKVVVVRIDVNLLILFSYRTAMFICVTLVTFIIIFDNIYHSKC